MVQSRERSAKKLVVFVKENWKKARPFILCDRSFLEEHFLLQQLDNEISEFTRQQYHKVTRKDKKWIHYQLFAHVEEGEKLSLILFY